MNWSRQLRFDPSGKNWTSEMLVFRVDSSTATHSIESTDAYPKVGTKHNYVMNYLCRGCDAIVTAIQIKEAI